MSLSEPATTVSEPLPLSLRPRFDALRAGYARAAMPNVAARSAHLATLTRALKANRAAIAGAIAQDFGHRSPDETDLLEIFPSLEAASHARQHVKAWMSPKRQFASLWFLPARTEIRAQPLGVVGIIVPWNYPLYLAFGPLAAALAAGNRVMLKMSEFTPSTGALVATIIAENFAADHVTVVNGDTAIAREFAALPFDHLLFTGSTEIGRHVMRAAAENLTPVTLELGGKSPAVIGFSADVGEAARKIMFGKCLNAGQTCIAPDYVLLPRAAAPAFVAHAKAAIAAMYPALTDNPDYSAIINARHHARLQALLTDAAAQGARVTPLAELSQPCGKIAPTLVENVTDTMQIMQTEIFGPLLPLVLVDSLEEAIIYVNGRPRPLALYYFGHDRTEINQVLTETIAGGVTINETLLHISQDSLPFGGVGPSGMGAYHGKFGFDTFSKLKPIFYQSRLNALALFKPPYGKRFRALINFLVR